MGRDIRRVEFPVLRDGRVHAHAANTRKRVRLEEGSVVAADVENDVAGPKGEPAHDLGGDAGQVRAHRIIDPGAVPVRVPVESVEFEIVLQLDESAILAENETKRGRWNIFLIRFREVPARRKNTKIE